MSAALVSQAVKWEARPPPRRRGGPAKAREVVRLTRTVGRPKPCFTVIIRCRGCFSLLALLSLRSHPHSQSTPARSARSADHLVPPSTRRSLAALATASRLSVLRMKKKSASFALFPSAGDNSRLTVSFQNWNRTMRWKNEKSFFHQFFSFLEVFRPEKSHASLFLLSSPGYKDGRRPWRTGRGSRS